ncbi:hypothetical protein PNK_p0032 (plasmid) [Candidatus Protochlamydia naegleriophila]|uniref:Uncharacterized protein n=1 Tax=Candidatus Protochlamydia naegleriophila TaxID=389348 RepID=A0A0U5JJW1_9BACT|nr:hypothetical protein [Candidatus Protochlamydia naegleriophila]CUI18086.1 hypothetical protein PNK_p0032 [Candidatus Protochlamydia naegleriophila]
MNPTTLATNRFDNENREIVRLKQNSSSVCAKTKDSTKGIFSKYPSDSNITKLDSTFEIKQTWLYSEWATECQFSKFIRPNFPNRCDLDPENPNPNKQLILSTFENVRGKWSLWQSERENARWKRVEVTNLKLDWVIQNVEVLYPSKEQFEVAELKGIVLWMDKTSNANSKRYKLYEGNHRISAWLATQTPKSLPAIIYIGKP